MDEFDPYALGYGLHLLSHGLLLATLAALAARS